jgi:hypothetical protein
MQLDMPFYEGIEDALKTAVQALGGAKEVGKALWPDKSADNAGRFLLDCLNTERPAKLDYSQLIWIFRAARDKGEHAPFLWFANEVGYEAKPITKAEEVDRLTTVVEQASTTLASALKSLERIQNGTTQLSRAA